MLTTEKLREAAKEAQEKNAYVYIINSAAGVDVLVSTTYSPKEVWSTPAILKVLSHENILKYDYSTWEGSDVSIGTLVDLINRKIA